jgi:hypothetical protein
MRVNSMASGTKLSPMRTVVQSRIRILPAADLTTDSLPHTLCRERARLGRPAEEERGREVRGLGGSGCRDQIPRAGVRAMMRRARRGRSGRLPSLRTVRQGGHYFDPGQQPATSHICHRLSGAPGRKGHLVPWTLDRTHKAICLNQIPTLGLG